MRRSWVLGSAALAILVVALPLTRVLAENAETEGSQIEAAGADADPHGSAKNLNTIPEDGFSSQRLAGPDNSLVRQLIASRPNEDLVICVAGGFSGRDPVVYAQPMAKSARAVIAPQTSLNGPMQNPGQKIDTSRKPGKAAAADVPLMPSQNPHAPAVINRTN